MLIILLLKISGVDLVALNCKVTVLYTVALTTRPTRHPFLSHHFSPPYYSSSALHFWDYNYFWINAVNQPPKKIIKNNTAPTFGRRSLYCMKQTAFRKWEGKTLLAEHKKACHFLCHLEKCKLQQVPAPAGWMSCEVALSKHAFLCSNTEEEHWLGQLQCLTLRKTSEGKLYNPCSTRGRKEVSIDDTSRSPSPSTPEFYSAINQFTFAQELAILLNKAWALTTKSMFLVCFQLSWSIKYL